MEGKEVLVFDTMKLAVRMEAAFWLERQFLQGKRHWFQQQDMQGLAAWLKSECNAVMNRTKKENGKTTS